MSTAEEKPSPDPASEPSVEERTQKIRQTQVTILAACIGADVVLFIVACWLTYKFGIDLSPAKLFTTALIFLLLCGALPAVALSVIWPKGAEHDQAGVRRTQYGYNVVMACRLLFGVLVIGNVILGKYGPRHFDWTSDKVFTLDSVSVKTARALEKPVNLIALYPRLSEPGQQLETLFLMYEDASKMVSHEFVSSNTTDKVRADEIFKQFPDSKVNEPVLIVTYGTGDNPEHKTIRHSEIFVEPPMFVRAETRELRTEFKGEDAITSAITQLGQAKKTNVYFSTGHGELDINNTDRRSDEGIGILKERMEAQGIKVDVVNLVQKEIPKDASILIVAGPKTPLFPDEIQKVREYLAGGGRLIAMLESGPEMLNDAATGLEGLLADYSVAVRDNLAIDVAANYRGNPVILLEPVGESHSSHAIVEELKEYNVIFDRAREVAAASPQAPPGMPRGMPSGPYKAEMLIGSYPGNSMRGTPLSWGETNYKTSREVSFNEGDDSKGPVSLVVAVSKNDPGSDPHMGMPGTPPSRGKGTPVMVVFGDASCAANQFVLLPVVNHDLFLNSVNWLRGRMELVGIQPKSKTTAKLTLERGKIFRMWFVPGVGMFLGLTGLGVLVWFVRHRF